MLINYLKSAARNLTRNKFYSSINIIGLFLGLLSSIFILLFINDELSYDKYHLNHSRIYRVESVFNIKGKIDKFAPSSLSIGPAMKLEIPEVEKYVRLLQVPNIRLKYQNTEYYEDDFFITDSSFFELFTYEFIAGNPKTALNKPFTMIMTQSYAKKYFGNENPIGKILKTQNGITYEISAIIKDLPGNSHLKFDGLISIATLQKIYGDKFNIDDLSQGSFWNVSVFSYIMLKKGTKIESVKSKFPAIYTKYMKKIGDQLSASFKPNFTPLADTHFQNEYTYDLPNGNKMYITIFAAIGIFILLIASINYMNLATAKYVKRAKEVGIRKVLGSSRGSLISQFLTESILIALISLILSYIAIILLLPVFNFLADKSLNYTDLFNPLFIIALFGITLLVGILSGTYPAFYLSSFQPAIILRNELTKGKGLANLRKLLVIVQFAISIIMIIGTMIVSEQLSYIKNKPLGFNKNNMIVMNIQDTSFFRYMTTFKEELKRIPEISMVSSATSVPGTLTGILVNKVETNEGEMRELTMNFIVSDFDYNKIMDFKFIAGRDFNIAYGTDISEATIINEALVKKMGWNPKNVIGKKIDFGVNPDGKANRNLKVIGVIKDYHFTSLHNEIAPIMILPDTNTLNQVLVKFQGNNSQLILDKINKVRAKFGANYPLNSFFLDENLAKQYKSEEKLTIIFGYFSTLCILISCLGLLGLTSFMAEQRTKEIGIRKALGAGVKDIVSLLTKSFMILVGIAYIIAVPLAWYFMKLWLEDFYYRIDISLGVFISAFILSMLIAFITVFFLAYRAANSNPVKSLRYE